MSIEHMYFTIIFVSINVGLGTMLLLQRLYIKLKEKNERL